MTLFKWHVVKAGQSFFVRKRVWYTLWIMHTYADAYDCEFYWDFKEYILKYCQFKNEASAIQTCEMLNVLG